MAGERRVRLRLPYLRRRLPQTLARELPEQALVGQRTARDQPFGVFFRRREGARHGGEAAQNLVDPCFVEFRAVVDDDQRGDLGGVSAAKRMATSAPREWPIRIIRSKPRAATVLAKSLAKVSLS